MPNPYPLLYRVGYTPWDGQTEDEPLRQLLAERAPGRALDAGCGSGRHSVLMAEHGWHVTGVDSVAKPLKEARERAAAAGVGERTRFVRGDVAQLDYIAPDAELDLVTDLGCLHGLTKAQQSAFADWITAHTLPGAELLLLACTPRRGIGPHGIDEAGVMSLFAPSWSVKAVSDAAMAGAGPLRGATFRWYRLVR